MRMEVRNAPFLQVATSRTEQPYVLLQAKLYFAFFALTVLPFFLQNLVTFVQRCPFPQIKKSGTTLASLRIKLSFLSSDILYAFPTQTVNNHDGIWTHRNSYKKKKADFPPHSASSSSSKSISVTLLEPFLPPAVCLPRPLLALLWRSSILDLESAGELF